MNEPISISPTTEDINAVLSGNQIASLQLQAQTLSRTLNEKMAEIETLKSEIEKLKEDND